MILGKDDSKNVPISKDTISDANEDTENEDPSNGELTGGYSAAVSQPPTSVTVVQSQTFITVTPMDTELANATDTPPATNNINANNEIVSSPASSSKITVPDMINLPSNEETLITATSMDIGMVNATDTASASGDINADNDIVPPLASSPPSSSNNTVLDMDTVAENTAEEELDMETFVEIGMDSSMELDSESSEELNASTFIDGDTKPTTDMVPYRDTYYPSTSQESTTHENRFVVHIQSQVTGLNYIIVVHRLALSVADMADLRTAIIHSSAPEEVRNSLLNAESRNVEIRYRGPFRYFLSGEKCGTLIPGPRQLFLYQSVQSPGLQIPSVITDDQLRVFVTLTPLTTQEDYNCLVAKAIVTEEEERNRVNCKDFGYTIHDFFQKDDPCLALDPSIALTSQTTIDIYRFRLFHLNGSHYDIILQYVNFVNLFNLPGVYQIHKALEYSVPNEYARVNHYELDIKYEPSAFFHLLGTDIESRLYPEPTAFQLYIPIPILQWSQLPPVFVDDCNRVFLCCTIPVLPRHFLENFRAESLIICESF